MLSKWWHPTHSRTSLAPALDVFPRTQGLAQLVLTRSRLPQSLAFQPPCFWDNQVLHPRAHKRAQL